MTPLEGLLQSYLDLQRHFDPAAASAAGVVSADARLGAFDAQTMREHLAAFRSIAGAIEDVELEALDDEIDRTALLADVRARVARFEQERPHVRDPGFWVGHVRDAVASLMGRAAPDEVAPAALARISAVPAFLEAARATIRPAAGAPRGCRTAGARTAGRGARPGGDEVRAGGAGRRRGDEHRRDRSAAVARAVRRGAPR